jgi:type I restriction enzyme S subunit
MTDKNRLPSGWAATSLDDVGTLHCGQSPPASEVNSEGKGTPYITGPEHWDGNTLAVDKWTTDPRRVVPSSCIFITVKGAGVGTLFPGIAGAIGRDVYAYGPSTELSVTFIEHSLRFSIAEILRHAKGDIPGLSKGHILGHRVGVPPRKEQDRVVAKIEELFSDLDAGVAALERIRANLKRYRAAVLKAAVEGRLTEEWRAKHPKTEPDSKLLERIMAERCRTWEEDQLAKYAAADKTPPKGWREKYCEPAPPDMSRLPELPLGWCWIALGQVARFQNGRAFPSKEYAAQGVRLLRPGNLFADGSVRWTIKNSRFMPPEWAEKHPAYIVRGNELVINLTAQSLADEFLGRICLTDPDERCLLNQRLARITPFSGMDKKFTLYLLKSSIFRRFVNGLNTGSLIEHMFTSQLEDCCLPMPPAEEQQEIVQEIERRFSVIEENEAQVDANLQRATYLRQCILKRAFEGKLVPQDPTDEPAEQLLERIRQERAAANDSVASRTRRGRVPKHDAEGETHGAAS